MKTTVENIDGVKWEFDTDEQFIEFTQKIYNENELTGATEIEDIPMFPKDFEDCENYINEYCGNLLLVTADEAYQNFWMKNAKALYDIQKESDDFYKEFHPETILMNDAEKQDFYRGLKR